MPLRFATGFFLAGVYPPALKLMATWFRQGRGTALGIVVGALTLGSALPHLVNGLGGLDWQTVVYATSVLTVAGGLLAYFAVPEGPYPFPRAVFAPRQAGLVFHNRGVRLASLGYFGHMWELYAMWTWFLVFATDAIENQGDEVGAKAAYATFAVIGIGAIGCWVGGLLGDRWGRTRTTAAMMAVSGTCALTIGLLYDGPLWALFAVGLVWGFTVVADSAQFSSIVTELGDQTYVAHGGRAPARGRVHADDRDDLADPVPRGRGRLGVGVRVPRPGPGARRGRDAAAAGRARGRRDRGRPTLGMNSERAVVARGSDAYRLPGSHRALGLRA